MPSAPDPVLSSPLRRFVWAAGLPIRGLRLTATTPALRRLALAPALISAFLVAAAGFAAWTYGGDVAASMLPRPAGDGWMASIGRAAWAAWSLLVHLVLFGVGATMATLLASVLASPWHDQLAARVEAQQRGAPLMDGDASWSATARDVAQGVSHSLLGLALYLALWLPLQALHLVPVVGEPLHLALAGGLSALFLARELTDYTLSRLRWSFRRKLSLLWAHRAAALGLGAGCLALLCAVVGATLWLCELDANGLLRGHR